MTEQQVRLAVRLLDRYNHPRTERVDKVRLADELWARYGVIVEFVPDARTSA